MKRLLLILLMLPLIVQAQPIDSTIFTFSISDTLTYGSLLSIDTSSAVLWQIGNTIKPIFSNDTVIIRGIMTDTLHPYPSNANDNFIMKISPSFPNPEIKFWHRYQTDSLHAGGIVEFSTDTGATWVNVVDCWSTNAVNFYSQTDTLLSGQPAFMGTSNGEQLSSVSFLDCMAFRGTSTDCSIPLDMDIPIYIRFRFVSDSTIDSLSGWMIDSIQVIANSCGSGVATIPNTNTITIYPNPITDELTLQSSKDPIAKVAVTNMVGQTMYIQELTTNFQLLTINCANYAPGLYFVRVNDGEVRKFVKE